MANFWFQDRATDHYFSHPLKEGSTYQTDWSKSEPRTYAEWLGQNVLEMTGVSSRSNRVCRGSTITELQEVDELICQFMGDPPPPRNRDSRFYYMCHELGFAALYKLGGSWVEEQHVAWIKTKCFFRDEEDEDGNHTLTEGELARRHALIEWVFLKKWRFNASG